MTWTEWCDLMGLFNPVYNFSEFPEEGQILEFSQLSYEPPQHKEALPLLTIHKTDGCGHFERDGNVRYLKYCSTRTVGTLIALSDTAALVYLDPAIPRTLTGEVYHFPVFSLPSIPEEFQPQEWQLWLPQGWNGVTNSQYITQYPSCLHVKLGSSQFLIGRIDDTTCTELGLPPQNKQMLAFLSDDGGNQLHNLETRTLLATWPIKPPVSCNLSHEIRRNCVRDSILTEKSGAI